MLVILKFLEEHLKSLSHAIKYKILTPNYVTTASKVTYFWNIV